MLVSDRNIHMSYLSNLARCVAKEVVAEPECPRESNRAPWPGDPKSSCTSTRTWLFRKGDKGSASFDLLSSEENISGISITTSFVSLEELGSTGSFGKTHAVVRLHCSRFSCAEPRPSSDTSLFAEVVI